MAKANLSVKVRLGKEQDINVKKKQDINEKSTKKKHIKIPICLYLVSVHRGDFPFLV